MRARKAEDDPLAALLRSCGIDPDHVLGRPSCKHKPTSGAWLSIAHACKCLHIRHDELYATTMSGEVRYRITGTKHQHLQVRTADLVKRWPSSFTDRTDRTT